MGSREGCSVALGYCIDTGDRSGGTWQLRIMPPSSIKKLERQNRGQPLVEVEKQQQKTRPPPSLPPLVVGYVLLSTADYVLWAIVSGNGGCVR